MKNRFSSIASLAIEPVLQAIYNHPVIFELIDGTLPPEKFVYYVQQDRLFLSSRFRALALAAAKVQKDADGELILHFAGQIIGADRGLHEFYIREYRAPDMETKSPSCVAYCAHVMQSASLGSAAEALAAILACLWTDREVGSHVRRLSDLDNPYFRWIESYSGDQHSHLVDRVVELADRLASDAGEEDSVKIFEAFTLSCRYEYCFWDDAYNLRLWPI